MEALSGEDIAIRRRETHLRSDRHLAGLVFRLARRRSRADLNANSVWKGGKKARMIASTKKVGLKLDGRTRWRTCEMSGYGPANIKTVARVDAPFVRQQ